MHNDFDAGFWISLKSHHTIWGMSLRVATEKSISNFMTFSGFSSMRAGGARKFLVSGKQKRAIGVFCHHFNYCNVEFHDFFQVFRLFSCFFMTETQISLLFQVFQGFQLFHDSGHPAICSLINTFDIIYFPATCDIDITFLSYRNNCDIPFSSQIIIFLCIFMFQYSGNTI